MTSRTVDAATAAIVDHNSEEVPDVILVWTSILNAVPANSAYRREVGPLVDGNEVVDFLFNNQFFPRSMLFCMLGIEQVTKYLKHREAVAKRLGIVVKMVAMFDAEKNSLADLHLFIDRFQEKLIGLDHAIVDTWFAPQRK